MRQTLWQGPRLTGHEGCLGEQIAEAVPAGVRGRADPGRVGGVERRALAGRGGAATWCLLGDGGELAGPVRRRGQGRHGPVATRPGRRSVADRAAAPHRVQRAQARPGGGDGAAADLAEGLGVHRLRPFADLEAQERHITCRCRGSQHWPGSRNAPTGGGSPGTAPATQPKAHGRRRRPTRSRRPQPSTQRTGRPGGTARSPR